MNSIKLLHGVVSSAYIIEIGFYGIASKLLVFGPPLQTLYVPIVLFLKS
jgi:hypothetical protein